MEKAFREFFVSFPWVFSEFLVSISHDYASIAKILTDFAQL
jgi:hypothetical protein